MRAALFSTALGIGLLLAVGASAQAAPSVTATCKDGTTWSGKHHFGACRGHKGVATWSTPAAATPAAAPAAEAPAAAPATRAANPVAPRTGAPGQVWVNTNSKVYHCPGTRYYGKTKQGEFMSEDAARAAGDHPSNGKACS